MAMRGVYFWNRRRTFGRESFIYIVGGIAQYLNYNHFTYYKKLSLNCIHTEYTTNNYTVNGRKLSLSPMLKNYGGQVALPLSWLKAKMNLAKTHG
jgi:hypothetical protein